MMTVTRKREGGSSQTFEKKGGAKPLEKKALHQGSGLRVQGLGIRVWGLVFRVLYFSKLRNQV